MSDFILAAQVADIPESGKFCTDVDDRFIVIVKLADEYFCLDDVCTHDGGPLGEAEMEDECLVCPRHGAKFDVRTGEARTMPATEPTVQHEIRVEDNGEIYVRLNEE